MTFIYILSEETPVYVGSDVVIEGPGYNPVYYWLFSLLIGGVSTIWGFSMLNFPDFHRIVIPDLSTFPGCD